jgi:hypothetical protein
MIELKATQARWSYKYGQWLDERRPWVRVELHKEVKALEAKIAELKKEGKK